MVLRGFPPPRHPPFGIHTATRLLPGAVRRPWLRSSQRPLGQGQRSQLMRSQLMRHPVTLRKIQGREQLRVRAAPMHSVPRLPRRGFQRWCRPPPRSPDEARVTRRSTPPGEPAVAGRRRRGRSALPGCAAYRTLCRTRRREAHSGVLRAGSPPGPLGGPGGPVAAAAGSDSSAARRRYGRLSHSRRRVGSIRNWRA